MDKFVKKSTQVRKSKNANVSSDAMRKVLHIVKANKETQWKKWVTSGSLLKIVEGDVRTDILMSTHHTFCSFSWGGFNFLT